MSRAEPPQTVEIADGISAYVQPDGSWFLNNTGFLVGERGVIAIDASSTEARTRTLIRRQTERPRVTHLHKIMYHICIRRASDTRPG